ncbi:protein of unknown function [Micropruina glycogenica]|uniref:Uncharacterized protein n=1 Tax=Micropruina glycogenica TaxID=75385 RepID=A0A2N9JCQ5_9ACTN|nr:protein of unknown function [Micropruina glycogenica]
MRLVDDVEAESPIDNGSRCHYVSKPIPPDRLTLLHRELDSNTGRS